MELALDVGCVNSSRTPHYSGACPSTNSKWPADVPDVAVLLCIPATRTKHAIKHQAEKGGATCSHNALVLSEEITDRRHRSCGRNDDKCTCRHEAAPQPKRGIQLRQPNKAPMKRWVREKSGGVTTRRHLACEGCHVRSQERPPPPTWCGGRILVLWCSIISVLRTAERCKRTIRFVKRSILRWVNLRLCCQEPLRIESLKCTVLWMPHLCLRRRHMKNVAHVATSAREESGLRPTGDGSQANCDGLVALFTPFLG